MSLMDNVISKAREFIGVMEDPPESNNVIFNTDFYGKEVSDSASATYPWCVAFLWDVFRMSGAQNVFCDGMKTASTEAVYKYYIGKNMFFSEGRRGDIILMLTGDSGGGRSVNHAGLVVSRNNDGSYETIEGNTGNADIANGGMVMNKTRTMNGMGYRIVGFARPDYNKKAVTPGDTHPGQLMPREIPISARLTIRGAGVRVRKTYNADGGIIRVLSAGEVVHAKGRIANGQDSKIHIADGWISASYVEGWVKDYNDNRRWWYLEKGYRYPIKEWRNIGGKDYCFGRDAYLFVNCYIKSAVSGTYYWVDENGAYQKKYDTSSPNRKYRVVENYKTENAYR